MSNGFYSVADRIERWLDRPNVGRFMDAAAMWWLAVAAVFVLVCLGILAVALVDAL